MMTTLLKTTYLLVPLLSLGLMACGDDGGGSDGGAVMLVLAPTSLNFGDVVVGQTSPMNQAVTVTNQSGGSSAVLSVNLAAGPFAIVDDGCEGMALEGLSSCRIEVSFSPTDEGMATTNLLVSESGVSETFDAALLGNGVTP